MDKEELSKIFINDRFASKALGAVIDEVSDGYSKVSAPVSEIMKNAVGGIMGGALFTLCDFAFAVANYASGDSTAVSLSSNISFLTSSRGARLIAEARAVRRGRKTNYYTVDVFDDTGAHICAAVFNGYIVQK